MIIKRPLIAESRAKVVFYYPISAFLGCYLFDKIVPRLNNSVKA